MPAWGAVRIQHDLMNAWLVRYVVNGWLDTDQAGEAWTGEDERLRSASSVIQLAMGQGNPPLLARGQSRSPGHFALSANGEAGQVGIFVLIGEPMHQREIPRLKPRDVDTELSTAQLRELMALRSDAVAED